MKVKVKMKVDGVEETYSASSGPPPSLSAGVLISSFERKSFASLLIVFGNLTSSIKINSNRMSWSLHKHYQE